MRRLHGAAYDVSAPRRLRAALQVLKGYAGNPSATGCGLYRG